MIRHNISDTVQLSGWLFADLLLGLMIIFFVSVPGKQEPPPIIPVLQVSPAILTPDKCTGTIGNMQCTVYLQEPVTSVGNVNWTATSDINDVKVNGNVVFNPPNGTLSPGGKPTAITISSIGCNNGSFTFSGTGTGSNSGKAYPVAVSWHCTPPEQRLDFKFKEFTLTVNDINGLLNGSTSATNDIKQQLRARPELQGRSVGLAIVSTGAPTTGDISQAQNISGKVYAVMGMLGQEGFAFQRASYYEALYFLGNAANNVTVDVYLFRV